MHLSTRTRCGTWHTGATHGVVEKGPRRIAIQIMWTRIKTNILKTFFNLFYVPPCIRVSLLFSPQTTDLTTPTPTTPSWVSASLRLSLIFFVHFFLYLYYLHPFYQLESSSNEDAVNAGFFCSAPPSSFVPSSWLGPLAPPNWFFLNKSKGLFL